MAREKRLISFTDKHFEMLTGIMHEDGQENFSYVVGSLIAKEHKEREELKNKRKQGRPRKEDISEDDDKDPLDYTDDLPKNIPYYGTDIGPREYSDKMALQEEMRPKGN